MSVEVVQAVRSQYPTPVTEEQSVKICNEVAWRLNGQASDPWGLRRKTGGTQWGGYALDVIVHHQTGELVDILFSTPTVAGAQWMPVGVDASLWAPLRIDWLPGTLPPDPPPSGDLAARVAALEARVGRLEARTQQAGEALVGA